MSNDTRQEAVKLTREQVALSTLVADALMDKTPTRSIADRADVIVRRMLNEPDVVVRAIDPDPYGLIELMTDCEEELRDARGRLYEYTGQLARLSEQLATERDWRDIACDWAFEQGDSDDLLEALAAAGYHVVQEGQAVVDDEVFSVESADDVAWADGNLYRLRPLTDESPTP